MQQRTASTRGVAAAASSKSRNACSFIAQLRLGLRLHIHVYLQVYARMCVYACVCLCVRSLICYEFISRKQFLAVAKLERRLK